MGIKNSYLWIVGTVAAAGVLVIMGYFIWDRLQDRAVRKKVLDQQSFVVLVGDAQTCLVGSGSGREADTLPEAALNVLTTAVKRAAPIAAEYFATASKDTSSPLKFAELPLYLYSDVASARTQWLPNGIECIVIANGRFGLLDPAHPSAAFSEARQNALDPQRVFQNSNQDGKPFSALRRLHFADFPFSYYQFHLVQDSTHQFFRLEPSVIYFREPITALRAKSRKQVEITLSADLPTSTGARTSGDGLDSAVLQTSVTISDLSPGSVADVLSADGTNAFSTQLRWFPITNLPNADTLKAVGQQTEGKITPFGAANFRVTYQESDKPDLLLQYVSEAVSWAGEGPDGSALSTSAKTTAAKPPNP